MARRRTSLPEERPKVSTVQVDVPHDERPRVGRSLDDVLRQVLWDYIVDAGWTLRDAAQHLAIPRATLDEFFNGGKPDSSGKRKLGGTSLRQLSRICAALKQSPVELFGAYEEYRPQPEGTIKFAEDAVYNRFRTVLDVKQAREALAIFESAKREGVIDDLLRLGKVQFPTPARPPKRKRANS